MVSVGFLNNLADLLHAERDLVANKVSRLILMGGRHNDDFNLVRHDLVETSQHVIEHWPTPLAISDFGEGVHTRTAFADTPADNPVREAYYRWFRKAFKGRSSWDQVAVLFGVRRAGDWFEEVAAGTASLRNGYVWELRPGWRTYVAARRSEAEFAQRIEQLMIKAPAIGAQKPRTEGTDLHRPLPSRITLHRNGKLRVPATPGVRIPPAVSAHLLSGGFTFPTLLDPVPWDIRQHLVDDPALFRCQEHRQVAHLERTLRVRDLGNGVPRSYGRDGEVADCFRVIPVQVVPIRVRNVRRHHPEIVPDGKKRVAVVQGRLSL